MDTFWDIFVFQKWRFLVSVTLTFGKLNRVFSELGFDPIEKYCYSSMIGERKYGLMTTFERLVVKVLHSYTFIELMNFEMVAIIKCFFVFGR